MVAVLLLLLVSLSSCELNEITPILTSVLEQGCSYQDVRGFLRLVCPINGTSYIKCPYSNYLYQYELTCVNNDYVTMTRRCPADPHHYQACLRVSFTPWVRETQGGTSFVCGNFLCYPNWNDGTALAAFPLTDFNPRSSAIWCDGKEDCSKVPYDELDCPTGETFVCTETLHQLPSHVECNRRCDCAMCSDEAVCNGITYFGDSFFRIFRKVFIQRRIVRRFSELQCVTDGSGISEDMLEEFGEAEARFNLPDIYRCTPIVMCQNLIDQTNCTDGSLAPLRCMINGAPATVSQNIICNRDRDTTSHFSEYFRSFSSGACDDKIDVECLALAPLCYIHKHQLCDSITDCPSGIDEGSGICKTQTSFTCSRKYRFNVSRTIPISWIMDGAEDCEGGMDEDETRWRKCEYKTHTTYGFDRCRDMYRCPSEKEVFIPKGVLCDRTVRCPAKGGDICGSRSTSVISRDDEIPYSSSQKFQGKYHLAHCLPGLYNLEAQVGPCINALYPNVDIIGTIRNGLVLPDKPVSSCHYFFGESYVFLSCTGRCPNSRCPLDKAPLPGTRTTNHGRITYSIGTDGRLFQVHPSSNGEFVVRNLFECKNGVTILFRKVCDLQDDCGDASDEVECTNHFTCNKEHRNLTSDFISLDKVCDEAYDCLDLSDEKSCCQRRLVQQKSLKVGSWIVGSCSLVLNSISMIESVISIWNVKHSQIFTDKVIILLINFGDWLTGLYLILIAIADTYFGDEYCEAQFPWLYSSYCLALGVVSTTGTLTSMFSMVLVSISRAVNLLRNSLYTPSPVTRKSKIKMCSMVVVLLVSSIAVAIVPLIKVLEDMFINALHFPDVSFLKGLVPKADLSSTLRKYFGRITFDSEDLDWNVLRRLVRYMFTSNFDGIQVDSVHFYGNDGVCLFKYFVSSDDPQVFYVWFILGLYFLCFFCISICYMQIGVHAFRSSSQLTASPNFAVIQKRNQKLQRKITVIILTDFVCWVPFIAVAFLHTAGVIEATSYYGLFSIIILPLNSFINPILYSDVFSELFKKIWTHAKSISDHTTPRDSAQ